jgi:uncharacterized protein (DUF934 family)
MAKIVKNRDIVADDWKVLTLAAGESPAAAKLPHGPVLVPLAVWRARKEDLVRREWEHGHALGVWLEPSDDPADIAADLGDLSVVGVRFPTAGDGRGHSLATLLRTRFGYGRELRAFGAFGRDQVHFLHRVGFDAIAVGDAAASAGLDDFSTAYQGAVDEPLPLFRREVAPLALAA